MAARRSIIRAYVLSRTLKGIQILNDSYAAPGDRTQPTYIPDIQTQTNANAAAITTEVSRATVAESGLNTSISNESRRAQSAESGLQSNINSEASIRANQINAVNVRCDSLDADKASVGQLNAESASIRNLVASNISAVNADIQNVRAVAIQAQTIAASKVTADQVRAIVGSFDFVTTSRLNTTVQSALQGTITCGTLRAGQIYIYDGGGYISLNQYVHRYT